MKKSNLGYIINAKKRAAARKRAEQEKQVAETGSADPKRPRTNSTTSEDSIPSPDYEKPPYDDSNMDIDNINDTSGISPGADSGDGSTMEHSRAERSAGGSSSVGMSNGGGLRGSALLPCGVRPVPLRATRVYRKQYLLRLQNNVIETRHDWTNPKWGTETNNINVNIPGNIGYIRYPYHDLPVNLLSFYLSLSEINELTHYTSAVVKECKVDVYNKTAVLNFETASSISTLGNNNVGVYLVQLSEDIWKKRTGQLPDQGILITEKFWGNAVTISKNTTEWSTTQTASLGAQYARRTLDNRFEYASPMNDQSTKPGEGAENENVAIPYFNANAFVKKRINSSMNEGHFTSWRYKPYRGLVAGYFTCGLDTLFSTYHLNPRARLPMMSNGNQGEHTMSKIMGLQNTGVNPFMGGDDNLNNMSFNMMDRPFRTELDATAILIENTEITGHLVPPLVIGIEPLVSEIPTTSGNKWEPVKCFVDIYVDVECVIELTRGTDYISSSIQDTIIPDYKNPVLMPTYQGNRIIGKPNYTELNKNNISCLSKGVTPRNGVTTRSQLKKIQKHDADISKFHTPKENKQQSLSTNDQAFLKTIIDTYQKNMKHLESELKLRNPKFKL